MAKTPPTKTQAHDPAAPQSAGTPQSAAVPGDLPSDLATYDRAFGEIAYAVFAASIAAVTDADPGSPRTDVERAANGALALAAYAKGIAARLAALPKAEFDVGRVWDMARVASAVVYLAELSRAAKATTPTTKLPADLDARSAEVEKRMQALCEYNLDDDPEIVPLLVALAPGTDYRDRAQDLLGYARIYEIRPTEVAGDQKNYRDTDLAEARDLAGKIFAALHQSGGGAATAADTLARAWRLLGPLHADVRATVLWLERANAKLDETFPTLVSAGRDKPVRKKRPAPPPPPPAPEPEPTS